MTNITSAIERARKELDSYGARYNNYHVSMQPGEHRVAAALYELLSVVDLFGAELKEAWLALAPGEGFEVLGIITDYHE